MVQPYAAASGIGELITELGTIISSCMTVITGNWLLFAVVVVAVGIPILGAVLSLLKNARG